LLARLEGDTVAHEAELTVGRGEPIWSLQGTIRESVRAEAAKRMNGGVTPSPPATDTGAAPSSGSKKVAFDNEPSASFIVVGSTGARGRKANRRRKNRVANQATAAAAPATVPVSVLTSSLPTGAAMYS